MNANPEVNRELDTRRAAFESGISDRLDDIDRTLDRVLGTSDKDQTVEELDRLMILVHGLAGSAGSLGFAGLSEAAAALEVQVSGLMDVPFDQISRVGEDLKNSISDLRLAVSEELTIATPDDGLWRQFVAGRRQITERSKKVVIVDDDERFLQQISQQLTGFGFAAIGIADHDDLAGMIEKHQPDAVVVDVVVPGDADIGVKKIAELRQASQLTCPVIFVSARADFSARLNALRAGGDGYLAKPLDLIELISLLDVLTSRVSDERIRVLMVDDDEDYCAFISEGLEASGVSVTTIGEPSEAFSAIRDVDPHVVLMDVDMPVCDGFELSRVIRQNPDFVQIPILFLSAAKVDVARSNAMQAGGDGYIQKSASFPDLLGSVIGFARRSITLRRAVDRRRESEGRFRAVAESAQDAIFTADRQGRIVFWNDSARVMFGYEADEAIGMSPVPLIPQIYQSIFEASDSDDRAGSLERTPHRAIEATGVTKSGQAIPVEVTVSIWLIEREAYVTSIIRNISDRKTAENALAQSEQRFRDIAELASDWFWETDEGHRLTYISPSGYARMKLFPSQVLGKQIAELADQSSIAPGEWERHAQNLASHVPFKGLRHGYRRGDGSTGWLSVSGKPMFSVDGRFVGYRGSTREISEQVEAERALQEASSEAESANRAKSEFLSSVSHELRTPLNAILGFGQLLNEDTRSTLDSNQSKYVNQVLKSGFHLLDLIDQILDLSKIELGNLDVDIASVALGDMIDECLSTVENLAGERGVLLDRGNVASSTPLVEADPVRTKQVLLNLLSNAIKYNRPDGKVGVSVVTRDNGYVRVSVSDTGAGIPESYRDQMFQPFHRLEFNAEDVEGSGIGLAFSKRLIELMDGRIDYSSVEDEGSVFWFELPIALEALDTLDPASSDDADNEATARDTEISILYIEDNPANLALMEEIVHRSPGVSLASAHTAEIGLAIAKSQVPNLIFMDINLPGMDGFSALKALREDPGTRHIPVIALSANAMPNDIERGKHAGFERYIVKPISIAEVANAITDLAV